MMANGNFNYYNFGQVPLPYEWSQTQNYNQPSTAENASSPICLSPSPSKDSDTSEPVLVSASVKIICPNEKQSEHKVFVLRDLDIGDTKTLDSLREEIYTQFGSELIDGACEFDLGYYKSNKRIWMRNNDDGANSINAN